MKQCAGSHCNHGVEGQRSKGGDCFRLQGQWAPAETGTLESHLAEPWRAELHIILTPFCLVILPLRVNLLCSLKYSRRNRDGSEDQLALDQSCMYGRFSKTLVYCKL